MSESERRRLVRDAMRGTFAAVIMVIMIIAVIVAFLFSGRSASAADCRWITEIGQNEQPFVAKRIVDHGALPPLLADIPRVAEVDGIRTRQVCFNIVNGDNGPDLPPEWTRFPWSAAMEVFDKGSTALILSLSDSVVEGNPLVDGAIRLTGSEIGAMGLLTAVNWYWLAQARKQPYPQCVTALTWKNRITGSFGWNNVVVGGAELFGTAAAWYVALPAGAAINYALWDETHQREAAAECAYSQSTGDPYLVIAYLRYIIRKQS